MSVNTITQTITSANTSANATSQLAADYDSFITLLVAQVQNQDPLSPMESTEFVSQLAQLTQVEQSVQVNTQMESLRQQLALNAALSETSLIGREVTVPTTDVVLGEFGAQFYYQLQNDASAVQAQIRDSAGNLVKVITDLNTTGGKMVSVEWDGTNDSGVTVPNGTYQVSIGATDYSGNAGSYNTYSTSVVTAIDYSEGSTYMQLADGRSIASGEIVRAQ